MGSKFQAEVDRLTDGRTLNEFDKSAVETVAGLNMRLVDARSAIAEEGLIIDDGKGFPIEHPALIIEKRASAELRGWVKDRPDLFGERGKKSADDSFDDKPAGKDKFGGFKLVT